MGTAGVLYIVSGVLALVGGLVAYFGWRKGQLKQTMEDTQTSKVEALRAGDQVEVKGSCVCDEPLDAPYCDYSCVHYDYQVREKRNDDWEIVDNGQARTPFAVDDGTGEVTVEPEGATFDARQVVQKPLEQDSDGTMELFGIKFTPGRRQRLTVNAVSVAEQMYVLGTVRQREDGTLVIREGDEGPFFISDRSEEHITRSLGKKMMWMMSIGGGVAFGGVVLAILTAAGVFGG